MNCQECNQRPATLHFTKIVNGEKNEFHICEVCAREKGEIIPGSTNSFSIHNLISGLLDFQPMNANFRTQQHPVLKCEDCGLTYQQFSKIGRFGCSSCYRYFADRLDPLLKRVHGNTIHAGKIPKRTGSQIKLKRDLDKLKKQLQIHIDHEEFEKAAEIRDQIRQLEKKYSS